MFLQGYLIKERKGKCETVFRVMTIPILKKNRRNVFNCRLIIEAIQAGRNAQIFVN